ncbi:unnamed protein product [Urochloa decumbens]|uniref:WAT1-related protein n=1 Tax=Urochloa decumbens TaxID=240449 RepID=A0ABC9FTM4_9POAL
MAIISSDDICAAVERYKPCAAMVAVQCLFAVSTLWVKVAMGHGMNPVVFVIYRQAVATIFLAPITIVANRRTRSKEMQLGFTGFSMVFVGSLLGVTGCLNLFYEGLHLGSSSMATAMTNLIPAITFLMAAAVGQERVNIREVSIIAKIFGTTICVGGAITIAFFKGPKLLNQSEDDSFMLLYSSSSRWVVGVLLLAASSACWSLWLIMQGPICKSYMSPLTLTTWTSFLSTLQSALLACFVLPDWSAWKINSLSELSCYIFVGISGSAVNFSVQSWCISVRGPLYTAMFMPLSTVITTVLAAIFLREELHVGIILGAVGIILGLYVVLWGKAEDARNGTVQVKREDFLEAVANMDSQLDIENTMSTPFLANMSDAQRAN